MDNIPLYPDPPTPEEISRDELLQQITLIFNKALDSDDDHLFRKLIETTGLDGIIKLADLVKYPRKDLITRKAIECNPYPLENPKKPVAEFMFGCRHPESKSHTFDRAFVVTKPRNAHEIMIALFNNGIDYIGQAKTLDEAFDNYDQYLHNGWVPMSIDDLRKITGVEIDDETLLEPVNIKSPRDNCILPNIPALPDVSDETQNNPDNTPPNKPSSKNFGFLRCLTIALSLAFLLKKFLP
jgi:hypothetical protein